jgi:MFS family permease
MQAPAQSSLTLSKRLRQWLGLEGNLVILLIAVLAIGAGEELWMRFVPKYLEALGASVFIIGLYDGLRTVLAAAYAYPGGIVADSWGHRRAFIAFNILSIAGYSLALLVPHWAAVIVGMFLFFSWSWFSLPATFSLVAATLLPDRHSMGIATLSVIKRLPAMFAPILGGILIDRFGITTGVRAGLAISIVLSTATILIQRRVVATATTELNPTERWNFRRTVAEFTAPLNRLLLSDILIRFCERIPFAWVVIFAMDYIGISARQVGMLILVEMLVAATCTIPAAHFADRHGREPFVIATFTMFTLFPIALLVSRNFPMLVVAFAVRGLKEFGDAPRKAIILSYCDRQHQAQMVGAYYLIRDLIVSLGALAGAYFWKIGPRANFISAAVFGIVGTVIYAMRKRAIN